TNKLNNETTICLFVGNYPKKRGWGCVKFSILPQCLSRREVTGKLVQKRHNQARLNFLGRFSEVLDLQNLCSTSNDAFTHP
ncbi:MAG: hypothetical protein ACTH6S_13140, partial [Mesonia sp.]|uniref:hypothetical protein n=1 Tax=Mesonia sp. TaxID=1960830 RepID=UPI003F9C9A15